MTVITAGAAALALAADLVGNSTNDLAGKASAGGLVGNLLCKPVGSALGFVTNIVLLFMCCRCWHSCSCRDLPCVSWCFRSTGYDAFDDFGALCVVHGVCLHPLPPAKREVHVRITAGKHTISTCDSKTMEIKGRRVIGSTMEIQEPVAILVEQGIPAINVDVMQGALVIATLELCALDVHNETLVLREQTLDMRVKAAGFYRASVKLSILHDRPEHSLDREHGGSMGAPMSMLLRSHLAAAGVDLDAAARRDKQRSETTRHCRGPLEFYGSWGRKQSVFFAASKGPHHRYTFAFWPTKAAFERNEPPKDEVEIVRVRTVAACPDSKGAFVMNFKVDRRIKSWTFNRCDRSRDTWVEHLKLVIFHARNAHDKSRESLGGVSRTTTRVSGATVDSMDRLDSGVTVSSTGRLDLTQSRVGRLITGRSRRSAPTTVSAHSDSSRSGRSPAGATSGNDRARARTLPEQVP